MFNATCCASGYPRPIISISGIALEVSFSNLTDGIYRGCATQRIATSGVTAGQNLTTTCNVSLTESVTCTAVGLANKVVPQRVFDNCQSVLTATVLTSSITLVAGK